MLTKQVYDLEAKDFDLCPVWFFPMDESVEDEMSVSPVEDISKVPKGLQTIVLCYFSDGNKSQIQGYIYDGFENGVDYIKPVAWVNDICITFWNGIIKPTKEYIDQIRAASLIWPISYSTKFDFGFGVKTGVLEGIYYFDNSKVELVQI